jgi:hypothetical protein
MTKLAGMATGHAQVSPLPISAALPPRHLLTSRQQSEIKGNTTALLLASFLLSRNRNSTRYDIKRTQTHPQAQS